MNRELKNPETEGKLKNPETYRICYKEHGKVYTYKETMYWENDLLHELSLYSDPAFGDRFELVSVFLVVDGRIDEKVYDGKTGWTDGLDRTEPEDLPGPDPIAMEEFQEGWDLSKEGGWDVDVDENGPFIVTADKDWKSTWNDYDPWDAYPQVSGEIWEPEYLGDR